MIENRFTPLKNLVTGTEVSIQVRIPGGLEYPDQGEAEILRWKGLLNMHEGMRMRD